MELLFSILRIGLASYLGLCLLVYARQRAYIYYPETEVHRTPADAGMAFDALALATADGETLQAWYVPGAAGAGLCGSGKAILFCHGNAGNREHRIESIRTFHDLGFAVLIFDYRGYGGSTGRPTETGTYEDALTGWRYLTEARGFDSRNLIFFGRSLGGAVAAWLAASHPPGLLLIESSFTSIPDMGARLFPYLPVHLLSRFRYATIDRIPRIPCPILIAHGPQDRTIPFEHGQRLFERAHEPKRFIEIAGDHNDGGMDSDQRYRALFVQWLETLWPQT